MAVSAAFSAGVSDCTGDLNAVDLAVICGRRESLSLAICICGCRAAPVAGSEAAVDTVSIRIIGNYEHMLLGAHRCGKRGAKYCC